MHKVHVDQSMKTCLTVYSSWIVVWFDWTMRVVFASWQNQLSNQNHDVFAGNLEKNKEQKCNRVFFCMSLTVYKQWER